MDLASLPRTLQHLVHGDGGGKGTQGIQAIKGSHNQGLGERLASMVLVSRMIGRLQEAAPWLVGLLGINKTVAFGGQAWPHVDQR